MVSLYPEDLMVIMGEALPNRETFRNYFPESFKRLEVTPKKDTCCRFDIEYLNDNTERFFINGGSDHRPVLTKSVAQELGEKITVDILEDVATHNRRRWIYIDRTVLWNEYYGKRINRIVKRNLEAADNMPEVFFVILLMYTLFQDSYSACVQPQIYDFMDRHEKTRIRINPGNAYDFFLNWSRGMFLEETQDKTLSSVYVLPDYERDQSGSVDLDRYMKNVIEGKYKGVNLSLILGDPGMGKSTLLSHFLAENIDKHRIMISDEKDFYYKTDDGRKKKVYLYCFNDMNNKIKWDKIESDPLIDQILTEYMCVSKESDLQDSILLLDGFDELAADEKQRQNLLPQIADRWGRYCKIVVTCRKHYVQDTAHLGNKISCVKLNHFGPTKMAEFICKYKGFPQVKNLNDLPEEDAVDKNITWYLHRLLGDNIADENNDRLEVYGIPIVLYMVLAMEDEIDLGKDTTIGAVYDRIFDEKGGIYKRQIKSYTYRANGNLYEKPAYDIKDNEVDDYCKYLGWVSRQIARYMFESVLGEIQNANVDRIQPFIQKRIADEKTNEPFLNSRVAQLTLKDILSRGMFIYVDVPKKSSENKGLNQNVTLRYVHKTMYEYFMAENIFLIFDQFFLEGKVDDDRNLGSTAFENFRKNIGSLLKGNLLSAEVGKFFFYKIKEEWNTEIIEMAVGSMMYTGLDDYKYNDVQFSYRQALIFDNLMYILQLFRLKKGEYDYDNPNFRLMFSGETFKFVRKAFVSSMKYYLKLGYLYRPVGNGLIFKCGDTRISSEDSRFDLCGIDLSGADLSYTDLSKCRFDYSDLTNVSFRNSNLSYATFDHANVQGVDFTKANLFRTSPSVMKLFDDESYKVPWTICEGYPLLPANCNYAIMSDYPKLLGKYVQSNAENSIKIPIKWKIVTIRGNRALLLSEKILDMQPELFLHDCKIKNWAESAIRKWLNNDFILDADFTEEDKRRLCITSVQYTGDNYLMEASRPTLDTFFLLSEQEVIQYLHLYKNGNYYSIAEAERTDYAKNQIANRNSKVRRYSRWLLRTTTESGMGFMYVGDAGGIVRDDKQMFTRAIGIRPACWIRLDI